MRRMARTRTWLALLLASQALTFQAAALAAGNCYTVYDTSNRAVYQSTEPPIDMSRSISEGMARRFPGHYLVMAPDNGACQEIADESRFAARAVANLGDSGTTTTGPANGRNRPMRDPLDSKLFREAKPLMFSTVGADRGAAESETTYYPRGSDARKPGAAVRVRTGPRAKDMMLENNAPAEPLPPKSN